NVTFSVTLEEYNMITPEDFEINLDYHELKSNQEGKIEVQLTKSPPSILNPRLSPLIVEFLFEKKE
ncbi:MAG: YbbR-like domain-containing protein, partial [Dysgonamonadaceae bacterium]